MVVGGELGGDRKRALTHAACYGLFAALFYSLTWQPALHGTDWRWFVLLMEEPGAIHLQHPGYFVVAKALWSALQPLDFDAYRVMQCMSILGGALCVTGVHRLASTLSGKARFAGFAAAMAMFSPALWHHATVVELHAAFAAVMVWSLVFAGSWVKTGQTRYAVLTGTLTGLATVMHGTGHLLIALVIAAVAWHNRERGVRKFFQQAGAYVTAHMGVWALLFSVIRTTGKTPHFNISTVAENDTLGATDPFDYILRSLDTIDLSQQAWPTVLHEWVEPYAPFSILLVAAVLLGRHRISALLLLGVLSVYLATTMILVQAWTDERGAYLLPLLAPGIMLALKLVRPSWWLTLLLSTFVCGLVFRGEPGRRPPDHDFGRAAAAMADQQRTFFFVADFEEMDGAFRADPGLDLIVARQIFDELCTTQSHDPDFVPSVEEITAWLGMLATLAHEHQTSLIITDQAIGWLSHRIPRFESGFQVFTEQFPTQRLHPSHTIRGWQTGAIALAAPTPR